MTHPTDGSGSLVGTELIVCDLDGVVYVGSDPVPGAAAALESFEGAGIGLLFATNNATRSRNQAAAEVWERTGYPARPDQMITSGWVTARWLRRSVTTALVVGEEGLVDTLREEGIEVVDDPDRAGAVVVGLDRNIDYESIARAAAAVRRGAQLVATNTDATYPTARGLMPGAGSIVASIEVASGEQAVVCGKPHRPMVELLQALAGGRKVAVVGDRVETDVALGVAAGWPTVLVLSGVSDEASARAAGADRVAASLVDALPLFGLSPQR